MKKILLIIPTYNEEDNILKPYQKIEDYNRKKLLIQEVGLLKEKYEKE